MQGIALDGSSVMAPAFHLGFSRRTLIEYRQAETKRQVEAKRYHVVTPPRMPRACSKVAAVFDMPATI